MLRAKSETRSKERAQAKGQIVQPHSARESQPDWSAASGEPVPIHKEILAGAVRKAGR